MATPNIVMTRIDERLVHGQGQLWVKSLGVNTVIVANDQASQDAMAQTLMKTVIPKDVAMRFYSVQKVIDIIHKANPAQTIFLIVKDCKDAIDAGFTSVMIDASHYPLEENIRIVKEVTDYAHSRPNYVSVEAELGRVGGQEDFVVAESAYAIPEECVRLVKETGVDCLAPALGSVHGPYHGEPKLGFKEMKEIAGLVNIPLVLHGGSGIPNDQLRMAIDRGTSKININTESVSYTHLTLPTTSRV